MKYKSVAIILLLINLSFVYARDIKNFGDYSTYHRVIGKGSHCDIICGTCYYKSFWTGASTFRCIGKDSNWKYYECKTCGTVYRVCRHLHWCYCTCHIEKVN